MLINFIIDALSALLDLQPKIDTSKSKSFEIALYHLLYSHIQTQISIHQHGFITQYIVLFVDNNTQVDVIYTD